MATSRSFSSPNSRHSKSRRSWFDAPPLTILDPQQRQEIYKQQRPKQKSPDSVETLTLTHFSAAPRLSFGKLKVGHTKFRNILIRNPHDYEQEVIIEKFPFKKSFRTEYTRFIVYPNDVFDLEISWTPDDEISVRELILFHVNDIYRVQAYVFGTAEKPKAPRKIRRGKLGPRVPYPTSVLQTPALSRIRSGYDRSSLETPVYGGVTECNKASVQAQATEDMLKHQAPFPQEVWMTQKSSKWRENVENVKPGEDVHYALSPLESTSMEGKLEGGGSGQQRRGMSDITSPSLNTMSPIPVSGEVEKGFVVDSYFKNNETAVDVTQSVETRPVLKMADVKDTYVCHEVSTKDDSLHHPNSGTVVIEPRPSNQRTAWQGRHDVKDTPHSASPSTKSTNFKDSSSFSSKANATNSLERKMRTNWSSPLPSGEGSNRNPVSPNTQLNQSLNLISQMSTPLGRNLRSPQGSDSSVNVSIISQGHGMVSPNSFLEDMRTFQCSSGVSRVGNDDSPFTSASPDGKQVNDPSPSRVLNNSIPHTVMVEHLHSIHSSLRTSGNFVAFESPLRLKKSREKRRSFTTLYRQKEKQPVSASDPVTNGTRSNVGNDSRAKRNQTTAKYIQGLTKNYQSPCGRKVTKKKRSPIKSCGKGRPARKSPRNKKSPGGPGKRRVAPHHSVQRARDDKSELPTASLDCVTPRMKSIPVDDRTVVKSQSFECMEENKTCVIGDTYSHAVCDVLGADVKVGLCNRKNLFSSGGQGSHEDISMPRKTEREQSGHVSAEDKIDGVCISAIDRVEWFVDKAGNNINNIVSDLCTTSQRLTTLRKNGKLVRINMSSINVVECTPYEATAMSPQFHTPTNNLPDKLNVEVSRRSTHIVRSPKVLNVGSMQQKCLNFDAALETSFSVPEDNSLTLITSHLHSPKISSGICCDEDISNGAQTQSIPLQGNNESGKSELRSSDCDSDSDSLTADSLEASGSLSRSGQNCVYGDSTFDLEAKCVIQNHELVLRGEPVVTDFNSTEELNSQQEKIPLEKSCQIHVNESLDDVDMRVDHESCTNVIPGSLSEAMTSGSCDDSVFVSERSGNESMANRSFHKGNDSHSKQLPMDTLSEDALTSVVKDDPNEDLLTKEKLKHQDQHLTAEINACEQLAEPPIFAEPTMYPVSQKSRKLQRRSASVNSLSSLLEYVRAGDQLQSEEECHSVDCQPPGSTFSIECDTGAVRRGLSPKRPSCRNDEQSHKAKKGAASAGLLSSSCKNQARNETSMGMMPLQRKSKLSSFHDSRPHAGKKPDLKSVTPCPQSAKVAGFSGRSQSVDSLSSSTKQKPSRDAVKKLNGGRQRDEQLAGEKGKTAATFKSVPRPAKGVAPSKLILIKASKTALPKHPMPFAARNMYYDERWMEKQERGFTQWLNFVLTPPDEYIAVSAHSKVDAGALALNAHQVAPRLAPTKEILSFRAYAARRRLNRLRRAACELYHSEGVVSVIRKVEIQVEDMKICVRTDKMLHADLGVKQKVLDLLLQYSSLWLRVGLETIFGEMLMLHSNTDIMGLSRFIVTRLLGSPDIAAEFAHPTVPHLYRDGYAAALSRHCLKKFLLLVYFLDRAKSARLMDHDPCLFCKDATFKSSKEILVEFSKEVLSGEGDLVKHLAYLGYNVQQRQKPIDEFDYAVTNLRTDLKDGLRLSRVVELLTNDSGVIGKLRVPAISRLQKIHNTDVFFRAMKDHGMDFEKDHSVTARDIVDGNREKTLLLLWHLILHFQANIQVNEDHLREEISLLTKSLQLKLAMQKSGVFKYPDSLLAQRDSGEGQRLSLSSRMQLIFRWCQLVCLHYGIKIENLTVSFSDGRAFCCLLHHYHPVLLPQSEINFETTLSFQAKAEALGDEGDADLSQDFSAKQGGLLQSEADPEVFHQLLVNEKANFKALYEKVSALGGVPLMVKSTDMSNTIPDERVVSTYVAYLCARLLDIRQEVRAARVIQVAWRRRKVHRELCVRQKAALVLQQQFRKYLMKRRAREREAMLERQKRVECMAVVVQNLWRSVRVRRNFLAQKKSAGIIQTQWRKWKAVQATKRELERRREMREAENRRKAKRAAQTIQRHVREWLSVKKAEREMNSAICIQRWWRGHSARLYAAAVRQELWDKAATVIQTGVRRMLCTREYRRKRHYTVLLQTQWRMILVKRRYVDLRKRMNRAAVVVQAWWRGCECSRHFADVKRSAVCIQRYSRGQVARNYVEVLRRERRHASAVCIQRYWRGRVARNYAEVLRKERRHASAVCIQRYWRGRVARNYAEVLRKEKRHASAVCIQRCWRGRVARKYAEVLRKERRHASAVCIQRYWRGRVARNYAEVLRREKRHASAVCIQRYWRGRVTRKYAEVLRKERRHASAVCIQRYWRGRVARNYAEVLRREKRHASAVCIQRYWRGRVARKYAEVLRKERRHASAVCIQRYWRGRVARNYAEVLRREKRHASAVCIQRYWRGQVARNYAEVLRREKRHASAVCLQRYWRGRVGRKYGEVLRKERRHASAVCIQRYWRGRVARIYAEVLRKEKRQASAVCIQRYWRGRVARKYAEVLRRERRHASSVCIQRYWRGRVARKYADVLRRERRHASAVCIQRYWRGRVARKYAEVLSRERRQASAVCIQRFWRGRVARKYAKVLRAQRRERAAITIQSIFKSNQVRKTFERKKAAAIIIQSSWRVFLTRRQVNRRLEVERQLKRNQAAIYVQKNIRGWLERKRLRQRVESAICMQRWWRGHMARARVAALRFNLRNKSATVIQAWVKGEMQLKKYQRIKSSTCLLQKWWRMVLARRCQEMAMEQRTNAAIVFQKLYRGKVCAEHFKGIKRSAVCVQRFWRGYRARIHVNSLRLARQEKAAKVIQTMWKSHLVRQRFVNKKRAALTIQKHCKRWLAQRELLVLRSQRLAKAAVSIQKNFRAFTVRSRFLKLKRALLTAQRAWRMKLALRQLDTLKLERDTRCAMRIQAAWRGRQARKLFREQKSAAITIQSFWRMLDQRAQYERQREAAIIIQRRMRATLLARNTRNEFLRLKACAVFLQSLIRCRNIRRHFQARRQAALVIQSSFRKYKRRIKFLALRLATVIIQRAYRNYCHTRLVRNHYLSLRQAAVVLQRHYRSRLHLRQRRREKSVIALQSVVRGFLARRKLQQERSAALVIQTKFRALQAMRRVREEFVKERDAARTIQSFYQVHLAAKALVQLKAIHQEKEKAAIRIQSLFKRMVAQRKYKQQRDAVLLLQTRFRNLKRMKEELRFVTLKASTIKIQSAYRMHLARTLFLKQKEAAIRLQAFARRLKAENEFRSTKKAALVIQRHFRAWKKGVDQRLTFLSLKTSALFFQKCYRRLLLVREEEKMRLLRHEAAVKIQSFYKAGRQREKYMSLRQSAICIQRRFHALRRGKAVRLEFLESVLACKVIQRAWRRYSNLKRARDACRQRWLEIEEQRKRQEIEFKRRQRLAAIIQRAVRDYLAVKRQREAMAAIKIQTFMRQRLARRQFLAIRRCVVMIQSHVRGTRDRRTFQALKEKHRAASVIQAFARGFLTRRQVLPVLQQKIQEWREVRVKMTSATKIQALWRGFVVRRDNTDKRLRRARRRVEELNRSATEEKTLGYRTSSALDYLFRDKDSAFILEALRHLEVATRLSPVCCERVAEVDATSVLFRLIGGCNRSLPHMDIIMCCIDIILNLAKYEKTVHTILTVPSATSTILDLLQIYREKGAIFLKASQLLGILAGNPSCKQVILACECLKERLQSIHSLVLRKHRCQQSRQATKSKMAAMKSFNSTLPVGCQLTTPTKRPHPHHQQPCPEWNLRRRRKASRDFDDPLAAISFVLDVLRIGPK